MHKSAATSKVDTYGKTEYLEGLGVFFHEECYPEGSRDYWRKTG